MADVCVGVERTGECLFFKLLILKRSNCWHQHIIIVSIQSTKVVVITLYYAVQYTKVVFISPYYAIQYTKVVVITLYYAIQYTKVVFI